jgi:hypothetical protein
MSSYEIRIKEVHDSTFAIGDNAQAGGISGSPDRDGVAEALRELLGIVSRYTDPGADEVLDLACAARGEIRAAEPDKEVFRRLVDATRKLIDKLGSRLIEAGALADAVAKIGELVRHL